MTTVRMSTTLIIFFISVFLLLKLTKETHCGCSDGECRLQGGATWGQSDQSNDLPIIIIKTRIRQRTQKNCCSISTVITMGGQQIALKSYQQGELDLHQGIPASLDLSPLSCYFQQKSQLSAPAHSCHSLSSDGGRW